MMFSVAGRTRPRWCCANASTCRALRTSRRNCGGTPLQSGCAAGWRSAPPRHRAEGTTPSPPAYSGRRRRSAWRVHRERGTPDGCGSGRWSRSRSRRRSRRSSCDSTRTRSRTMMRRLGARSRGVKPLSAREQVNAQAEARRQLDRVDVIGLLGGADGRCHRRHRASPSASTRRSASGRDCAIRVTLRRVEQDLRLDIEFVDQAMALHPVEVTLPHS